jgi:hypothetical protein
MSEFTASPFISDLLQAPDKTSALETLNAVKGSGIVNITAISRTDYDNLVTPDPQTLYIVDENS